MTSTFTFASPWALSPTGRDELLRSFRESESGAEAQFLPESSDPEAISLRCTEQCFIDFVEFSAKFYDQELSQPTEDMFEEPKLIRIEGTVEAIPPETSSVSVEEHKSSPSDEQPVLVDPLLPLILHETVTTAWKPPGHQSNQGHREDHDHSRFWLVLPNIIGRLERLAGVRMELPLNSTDLTIHGDSEAAIAYASQKLDTLEKAMSQKSFNYNHIVSEAELSPQFCLLPLKEVSDSRLRTTLLSPQSSQFKSLRNSNILVIIKDGEYGKIEPASRNENSKNLWAEHPLTLQTSGTIAQNTTTVTPVTRWVEESNSAQIVDPFTPQVDSESASQNPQKIKEPKLPSQEVISTKRVRKVKGAVEPAKTVDMPLLAKHDDLPTCEPPPAIETGSRSMTHTDGEDSSLIDVAPHAREESSHPPTQLQGASSLTFPPPVIRPPFMPPPSMAAGRSWEPARHDWDDRTVPAGNKFGKLVNLESPLLDLQETKPTDKKTYRTMGQKKAQMITSQTQLVKIFDEEVKEVLRSVTACCNVKISVLIGRILVDRHTVPLENRKKPFSFNEWHNVTSHIKSDFTERITTRSSDISNLVGLKQARGRRIFEEAPFRRKVTYNITCLTRNSEKITIEIAEDGDYAVRGETIVNGVINWHFPKRAWDACLQVRTHEFMGGSFAEKVGHAQVLATSLQLSEEGEGAGLKIRFSSKGSGLQAQSITLRREIIHAVLDFPDLQLHVTEVQSSDITQSTVDEDYFTGTLAPQHEMVAHHRLWWDVSISSQHADEILRGSENLEPGEKAEWKPETVLKCGVEDMYELAQDIVTRIDFVGIGNRGPATSKSKGTKPSERSYELPTGVPGYW